MSVTELRQWFQKLEKVFLKATGVIHSKVVFGGVVCEVVLRRANRSKVIVKIY